MKLIRSYHIFFLAALCSSCAHIVTPTGGDKDETSPKIVKMSPSNYSTEFNSKSIAITFDEYVSLKNAHQQVVISPPLNQKPEYKVFKKSLIITLKDTLADNTTYTINLGEAVVDITEGNPLDSNLVVFSTGTYIDSMSVYGNVTKAFDLSPGEDVYVMLYDSFEDSLPYTATPNYFSKTDPFGSFSINNIRKGNYKVFALRDANRNYAFDNQEEVAFLDSVLVLDSGQQSLGLNLFTELDTVVGIETKTFSEPGLLTVFTKGHIEKTRASVLNQDVRLNYEYTSRNNDTLKYWLSGMKEEDTVAFILELNNWTDTLDLYFKKDKNKEKSKPVLSTRINALGKPMELNSDLRFIFGAPVNVVDLSQTKLISIKDTISFTDNIKGSSVLDYTLKGISWQEELDYKIVIPKGSFMDIYKRTNDSLIYQFKTRKLSDYGSVKFKIDIPEDFARGSIIIQLLDKQSKVHKSNIITSDTTLLYEYENAASYKVKAIFDTNNNGQWDTGNYMKKVQPEKVAFYNGTIDIRANWDIEAEWKIPGE